VAVRCRIGRWLVAAATLAALESAHAQDMAVRWGVAGRVEYNDNYFFTDIEEQRATTLTITPFLAAIRRTDTSELVTVLTVGGNKVWGDADFDYLTGRAEVSGRQRVENGVWSGSAGFVRSLSLQSTLLPEGLVYTLSYLNNTYASGSYSRAVSETWTVEARASATDNKYSAVEGPNPLVDNYAVSGGVVAYYRYDERTYLSWATDYAYFKSDDEKSNSITSVLGITYRYSPRLAVSGTAGYFWDHRDVLNDGVGRVRDNAPLFGGDITYDLTENTRVSFRASQRLSPSATGDLMRSDSVGAGFTHRAAERLVLRGGVRYDRDQLEGSAEQSSLNNKLLTATVGATYRFDARWSLDAGYTYTRARYQDDQGEPRSNVVFVTVAWNLPEAQLESGLPRLGIQGVPGAGPIAPPATSAPAADAPAPEPLFEPLLLP